MTTPSNGFEWNTSNPTQMPPTKITTKPLVTMSNGLLVDHSRITIGMEIIVIIIFLNSHCCPLME